MDISRLKANPDPRKLMRRDYLDTDPVEEEAKLAKKVKTSHTLTSGLLLGLECSVRPDRFLPRRLSPSPSPRYALFTSQVCVVDGKGLAGGGDSKGVGS